MGSRMRCLLISRTLLAYFENSHVSELLKVDVLCLFGKRCLLISRNLMALRSLKWMFAYLKNAACLF